LPRLIEQLGSSPRHKTKNGNSYAGFSNLVTNVRTRTHLVGAFSATHTTKVTSPPLFSIKSRIQNISYAKNCIPMIRVAPRNDCRLIRYRQPQAEVRRSAREGLEAASRRTEPGRDNRDEPQRPCPTPLRSEPGRLDLLSFDSNLEPNPQNLHRGEAIGPLSLSNDSGICREAG